MNSILKNRFLRRINIVLRSFNLFSKGPSEKNFQVDQLEIKVEKLRKTLENDENVKLVVPIFKKAFIYGENVAVKDSVGEHSYLQLYAGSHKLALQLSNICGSAASKNISIICPNNIIVVVAIWACWISGQVGVPISIRYPEEIMKYIIKDSGSKVIITTPELEPFIKSVIEEVEIVLLIVDHSFLRSDTSLRWWENAFIELSDSMIILGTLNNEFYSKSNAMVIYTLGSTGKPTRSVLTYMNINAVNKYFSWAWKLSNLDCLLHVLPHNHIFGCINGLMCPLSNGAKVIMHDSFSGLSVWNELLGLKAPVEYHANMFLAVPKTYEILIEDFKKYFSENTKMVQHVEKYCNQNIRLMVAGLSPLQSSTFFMWRKITGHNLLECNNVKSYCTNIIPTIHGLK